MYTAERWEDLIPKLIYGFKDHAIETKTNLVKQSPNPQVGALDIYMTTSVRRRTARCDAVR